MVAVKNAYALLAKQRFGMAAAFFVLGGRVTDAARICTNDLKDPQLGLLIARLAPPSYDRTVLQTFVCEALLPAAEKHSNLALAR